MTNEQHHPEHAQDAFIDALFEQSPVNIAALLRACADDELSPEQCRRLEELISKRPEAQSQHDFEQQLRACCKRSMNTAPACPDALRQRIGAIAAQSRAGSDTPDEQRAHRSPVESVETSQRSFWARSPLMAVAAMLLLSIAGVLVWQSVNLSGALFASPRLNLEQASYSERIGNFVLNEHTRCCDDTAARSKLVERDAGQAIAYFSQRFDRPVQMPSMNLAEGTIEFYGGGDCKLPSTSVSGHLRFDTVDDRGNTITLSLFIAPDPGILPIQEGMTYKIDSKACDEAGVRLFVWVSQGVQYLLVSEAPDKACASVRSVMNAPERLSRI